MHIPMVSSEQWLRRPGKEELRFQHPQCLELSSVSLPGLSSTLCSRIMTTLLVVRTSGGYWHHCQCHRQRSIPQLLRAWHAADSPAGTHALTAARWPRGQGRSALLPFPDLVPRAQLVGRTKIVSRTLRAKCSAASFWGVCPCCAGKSEGWQEWRIPRWCMGFVNLD